MTYLDDLSPLADAPPWFPLDTLACRLTADTRQELAEMCACIGLPEPEEDYQLLTPAKRFLALRYGALDPFAGAGTTGLVAHRLGRAFVGDYAALADALDAEARQLEEGA